MVKYIFLLFSLLFGCGGLLFAIDSKQADSLELRLGAEEQIETRIDILNGLGTLYLDCDSEKAMTYVQQSYEFSKASGYTSGMLSSTILLSQIMSKQSQMEQAFKYAQMAQDLIKDSDNQLNIISVKVLLANLYLTVYDLDHSLELFYESLRIAEKVDNKRAISTALNGIGIIYFEQANYEKAYSNFSKCYQISVETKDTLSLAAALNNIASSLNGKGDYERSIRYHQKSTELQELMGNKYGVCMGYKNLGESYKELDSLELAFAYVNKANLIAIQLKDYELISSCECLLAECYFELDNMDSCIYYAHMAYDYATQYKFPLQQIESAEILHRSFARQGSSDEAYKYAILYSELKEEFNISETIRKTTQLGLQYQYEKENQLRIFEQQKRKGKYVIITIVAIFLTLLIFILLIARHRITLKNMKLEKAKIDGKLELRNKELTLSVMTLLKKNDMLTTISKELLSLRNSAIKEETKGAINKIVRKIKRSTETELWKEFELRFKEVHSDFYDKLLEKYPSITAGEMRLCALLRLNMTTKEISALTGQSTQTLEKARYRIRKKLEIGKSSVNLVAFLAAM